MNRSSSSARSRARRLSLLSAFAIAGLVGCSAAHDAADERPGRVTQAMACATATPVDDGGDSQCVLDSCEQQDIQNEIDRRQQQIDQIDKDIALLDGKIKEAMSQHDANVAAINKGVNEILGAKGTATMVWQFVSSAVMESLACLKWMKIAKACKGVSIECRASRAQLTLPGMKDGVQETKKVVFNFKKAATGATAAIPIYGSWKVVHDYWLGPNGKTATLKLMQDLDDSVVARIFDLIGQKNAKKKAKKALQQEIENLKALPCGTPTTLADPVDDTYNPAPFGGQDFGAWPVDSATGDGDPGAAPDPGQGCTDDGGGPPMMQ